ncbi:MAG: saccharopine dehydrogenase NADP-binding domain-containing protein [Bacteroidetes bacterium]|nr:saccharopine dehydrogenase NADP-binding domain-containing protein [Bacteroidota bacterium]
MKQVVVLGAGMIGRTIATELAERYAVRCCDVSQQNLRLLAAHKNISLLICNVRVEKELHKAIEDADLVIGAVPGFMGYDMLQRVIKAGKNIVDISFFSEDALTLDALAKKNQVTAIVDCGLAPGMDNVILGYHSTKMNVVDFVCMVGGLPKRRTLPFQYKAPFSPIDVLEEYTRPARIVENHQLVVKPALSEPELIEFDEVGTLEAFNTDGLRSLIKTMPVKNMKEITLRYPGHRQLMEAIRDMGFFNQEEVDLHGMRVKPIDVTAQLFFPKWKYEQGEEEFTVMRIIISGEENGKSITYTYNLYDEYDKAKQTSSMARTTGFTCCAAAELILQNKFTQKGIIVPEYLGKKEKAYRFILDYLSERNIHYKQTITIKKK